MHVVAGSIWRRQRVKARVLPQVALWIAILEQSLYVAKSLVRNGSKGIEVDGPLLSLYELTDVKALET